MANVCNIFNQWRKPDKNVKTNHKTNRPHDQNQELDQRALILDLNNSVIKLIHRWQVSRPRL